MTIASAPSAIRIEDLRIDRGARTVIDTSLADGHGLVCLDIDGDGSGEIVAVTLNVCGVSSKAAVCFGEEALSTL